MANRVMWTLRNSDSVLIKFCDQLEEDFGIAVETFSLMDNMSISRKGDIAKGIEKTGSYIIREFSFSCFGSYFVYKRGESDGTYGICDRFECGKNQSGNENLSEIVEILSFCIEKLHVIRDTVDKNYSLPSSNQDISILSAYGACLERLEDVNTRITDYSLDVQGRYNQQYDALCEKLKSENDERRNVLEDEYRLRLNGLDEKETELKRRESILDINDNKHERRALRKALLDEIKSRSEKFSLTTYTQFKRFPIHMACLIIVAASLYLLVENGTQLYNYISLNAERIASGQMSWIPSAVLALKQIGITLVLISSSFFYINWMNKWFEQHAQAEFQLKQFQLDIERASWLVETALDWHTAQQQQIPEHLLVSLSNNLFSSEKPTDTTLKHPGDVLASALLGTATKVNLHLPNADVECDGKRLRAQMEDKGKPTA